MAVIPGHHCGMRGADTVISESVLFDSEASMRSMLRFGCSADSPAGSTDRGSADERLLLPPLLRRRFGEPGAAVWIVGRDNPASARPSLADLFASAVLALAPLLLGGCELVTGPARVGGLEVTLQTNVLVAGDTLPLDAEVRSTQGELLDRLPGWSSSAPDVATVLSTGELHAKQTGEAWIVAELDGHQDSVLVRVAPAELPLFMRPFDIDPGLSNPFDHRLPLFPDDPHPEVIDWTGASVPTLNGHGGYDWPIPTGTPLLSVADGLVRFAGREEPWSCPLLNGDTVAAYVVRIRHTAMTGEVFHSVYIHLDRVDVAAGDSVRAGQPIGLSGNTGCSTGPHLHFAAMREYYWRVPKEGYVKVMDPSGWRGGGLDAWLLDSGGVASTRLWIPGHEPALELANSNLQAAHPNAIGPIDLPRPGSEMVELQE